MLDDRSTSFERVLILAFNGWSDAGSAATTAVEHLSDTITTEVLHAIGCEGYVDLQMYRPVIKTNDDGSRDIEWPDSLLLGATSDSTGLQPVNDSDVPEIFLFSGTEPAHNWLSYCDEIIDIIDGWQIDLVVTLGSMFSDAPHTRPIPISVTSENKLMRQIFDAEKPDYEGPVGISSVLNHYLVEAEIPTIAIWAQVPHYVHSAPSPKATHALLDRIEEILNVVIPRGSLLEEATEWEQNINNLAATDDEMRTYIERLEEARDTTQGASSTGDAIAYELEKFLRKDDNNRQNDSDSKDDNR